MLVRYSIQRTKAMMNDWNPGYKNSKNPTLPWSIPGSNYPDLSSGSIIRSTSFTSHVPEARKLISYLRLIDNTSKLTHQQTTQSGLLNAVSQTKPILTGIIHSILLIWTKTETWNQAKVTHIPKVSSMVHFIKITKTSSTMDSARQWAKKWPS